MAKSHNPPPKIRACLFDMDGLLIDSEDKYTICTNSVLRKYGKPDLPWNIKAQMQGRPGPDNIKAGRIFREWAQLPISPEDMTAQIAVQQREQFVTCKPLPGVEKLLRDLAAANPKVAIALATSSHRANFVLKTDHQKDLFKVFTEDQRVLGDDSRIPPGKGKPAPDIYLLALKLVNEALEKQGRAGDIKPAECLVFEDSVPGVESGRRAGMQCIWCPHPGLLQEYKGREKQVLAGLMGEYKEIKPDSSLAEPSVPAVPGEIDDGWATFVPTLEQFPYEKFGISTA